MDIVNYFLRQLQQVIRKLFLKSIYYQIETAVDHETERLMPNFRHRDANITVGQIKFAPFLRDLFLSSNNQDINRQLRSLLIAKASPKEFDNLHMEEFGMRDAQLILDWIPSYEKLDVKYLRSLSDWLIYHSQNISSTKLGIALAGIFKHLSKTTAIALLKLAKYDELTAYSLNSLLPHSSNSNRLIIEVAKEVSGWGRIYSLWRLEKVEEEDLQEWLLTEGYKNNVMYEESIYVVIKESNLVEKLENRKYKVTDDSIIRLTEILSSLIRGGPNKSIVDLTSRESNILISQYFKIIENYRNLYQKLSIFNLLMQIKDFLSTDRIKIFSKAKKHSFSAKLNAFTHNEKWKKIIIQNYKVGDSITLYGARIAARNLKLDTWNYEIDRVRKTNDGYYFLLDRPEIITKDRLEQILNLSRKAFDLRSIATGPADQLFPPERSKSWHEFSFVIQGLQNFPYAGHDLIRASLFSPVTGMRNGALNVIEKMSMKDRWKFNKSLKLLLEKEVNEGVIDRLEKILSNINPTIRRKGHLKGP